MQIEQIKNKMNIEYSHINKKIHNLFLERSEGTEFFIMSFDESDMKSIADYFSITQNELITEIVKYCKNDWKRLLRIEDDIPQGFGFIALQIYCASKMGESEDFSESNFNPILSEYLSVQNIQEVYSTIQDDLWKNIKNYINLIGFKENIPKVSHYAWRYVRYPLSQVYLNKKDLSLLKQYFSKLELKINQSIDFQDFVEVLKINTDLNNIPAEFKTSHYKTVLGRKGFSKHIAKQQIYKEYINWDGKVSDEQQKVSAKTRLFFENYSERFYYFKDSKAIVIERNNFKNNLLKFGIISKSTKHLILRVPEGKFDYEDVNKVRIDDDVIILVLRENIGLHINLQRQNFKQNEISSEFQGCKFYNFKMTEEIAITPLGRKIISKNRHSIIEIKDGFRIKHNKYLFGFGPKYLIKKNIQISINKYKKYFKKNDELDLSNRNEGKYKISLSLHHSFTIEIIKNKLSEVIGRTKFGWNLNQYSPLQKEFDLFGLLIDQKEDINTITNFLEVSFRNKPLNTNNQLLKALTKIKKV